MEYLLRILIIIVAILIMFFLTKLMGNKQMSELTVFDYINGITIGSIASELSIAKFDELKEPLIAMIIFGVFGYLISFTSEKSLKIRRFVSGKSYILMDNGKIYYKAFKKARLDMSEFMIQCRINGIFDLNEIETAIFESNGSISFLPKTFARGVQVQDLNLDLPKSQIAINVIIDGKILYENLKKTGNNKQWLMSNIKEQKKRLNDIFIAYCDSNNNLKIYEKDMSEIKNDVFQ